MIFVSIQPSPPPLPQGRCHKTTRNYWKGIKYCQTLEHAHLQINASYTYLIKAPFTLLKLY